MPKPDEFLSASNTCLGWAFGTSRTGASHRQTGQPCDDAFALWSGSAGAVPCVAVAVADGHGDPRHDQSRIGAGLAVRSAVEELVAFHHAHLEDIPPRVLKSEFRGNFPRRVSRRWRESVTENCERRGLADTGPEKTSTDVFTRYGSTLIAAAIIADTILIGQIGDGDIVLVRPDGMIESPIPGETSLTGGETRSLSSRDAHLFLRTATLDRGEGGVLIAATDGISDSFDGSEGPEFVKFIQSIVARIRQYGVENVAEAMGGWLDRYSQLASGDDMTLVFVVIRPQMPVTVEAPIADNQPEASWGF